MDKPFYKILDSKNIKLENEWFEECKSNDKYFLYAYKNKKYYTIVYDHISLNISAAKEQDIIGDKEKLYLERIKEAILRSSKKASQNELKSFKYNISIYVGEIKGVPEKILEELLQELDVELNYFINPLRASLVKIDKE